VVVARVDAKPEVKVEPKPEPKPMVKPEPKIEAKAVAKAEPKPEPKVEPKPVAGKGESDEVLAVVNDWADAWSAQDMKRYLGHYGQNFDTPKGESRAAWAAERNARIAGKGRISVKVESPQVTVDGSTATVKFRQLYASDRLQADSRKTLTMVKQGGKWQIKQERTGS
jgi:ketosteroid isomerase-like protein